ncbi:MAG: DUF721 domain-containing protein [Burkholderiales bacterium]|nr:DUF721 domain-containing protein [Burkholderiales bacterium]MDE2288993.1 DUF721 domain-containing protein [Burkholderiales bacterium]MDE2611066.1 DUF721 domain-containing protein [Burkholderiales bacterium]
MKSSRSQARPLSDLLYQTEAAGSLMATARQLGQLERDLHRLLPAALAANVTVVPPREGTLVLLVAHNALAARLRQQAPSLLDRLRQKGWQLEAVRIRVSLKKIEEPARHAKEAHLSRQGLSSLRELRDGLPASPLRDALDRLVAHHSPPGPRK